MKCLSLNYKEFVSSDRKWADKNFDVDATYNIGIKITKLFRLCPLLKLPMIQEKFCGNWKNRLNDYDAILLSVDRTAPSLVNTIHFINPNIRIIVYYWNCVALDVSPKKFNRKYCELWSFDSEDCRRYQMNFNSACMLNNYRDSSQLPIKNDVCFLGKDKNRLRSILEIKKVLQEQELKCEFHIIASKGRKTRGKDREQLEKRSISYNDYIEIVKSSRAILDFNVPEQSGISQRPFEALHFRKKLITNNRYIQEYDFYDKNNVFILGVDDIAEVKTFLNSPSVNISKKIEDRYYVASWIERFKKDNCKKE